MQNKDRKISYENSKFGEKYSNCCSDYYNGQKCHIKRKEYHPRSGKKHCRFYEKYLFERKGKERFEHKDFWVLKRKGKTNLNNVGAKKR